MRIIDGADKGRTIIDTKGMHTRRTPDRGRESVFSIISAVVPDAVVLVLFAGTVALGLEALSRGAREATFVERDKAALASLRKNIEAVAPDASELLPLPYDVALRKLE